jgi:hypothetical protein
MSFRGFRRSALLFVALAAFGVACESAPPVPYTSLESALDPLVDAFNAQAGRVRVVMLVAPT